MPEIYIDEPMAKITTGFKEYSCRKVIEVTKEEKASIASSFKVKDVHSNTSNTMEPKHK